MLKKVAHHFGTCEQNVTQISGKFSTLVTSHTQSDIRTDGKTAVVTDRSFMSSIHNSAYEVGLIRSQVILESIFNTNTFFPFHFQRGLIETYK